MIDFRIAIVAALTLGSVIAWQHGEILRGRTTLAEARTTHAQQLQRIADKTTAAAAKAVQAQQAHQQAVAAIDTTRTQEKDHALADHDHRRNADPARPGGMRIPATCPARPASGADLPGTASTASVDAPAAEVPAAFRQELWDLRAALITERAQLLALQDYALTCSAGGGR